MPRIWKNCVSINRHDAPITHTLQQFKNATGCMPLDGLLLFITFSWLCNSVTVVIVQLQLIQIYAVYRYTYLVLQIDIPF